jgi:hypothetical protein
MILFLSLGRYENQKYEIYRYFFSSENNLKSEIAIK